MLRGAAALRNRTRGASCQLQVLPLHPVNEQQSSSFPQMPPLSEQQLPPSQAPFALAGSQQSETS